jgi:hypothetical protein
MFLSAWGKPEDYADPTADIKATLKIASIRSWLLNISVFFAAVAWIAIAYWVLEGTHVERETTVKNSAPLKVTLSTGQGLLGAEPLPVTLSLHCKPIVKRGTDKKLHFDAYQCNSVSSIAK